jgi:hypothetical protein
MSRPAAGTPGKSKEIEGISEVSQLRMLAAELSEGGN